MLSVAASTQQRYRRSLNRARSKYGQSAMVAAAADCRREARMLSDQIRSDSVVKRFHGATATSLLSFAETTLITGALLACAAWEETIAQAPLYGNQFLRREVMLRCFVLRKPNRLTRV
jgi:hypothetical protein